MLAERGWDLCFWVDRPSELYEHLAAEGYDVDGAPRHVAYTARAWRLEPGARARARSLPPYLRRFRRFLRHRSPALVHANSTMSLAEGLVARAGGSPVLLYVHEMVPAGPRGTMLRRLAWMFDEVVAVSQSSAQRLERSGRRPRIVNGGTPMPEPPADIRADPRPFTVGTVGVISPRKGSDLFVEAARRLLEQSARFSFEMVGPPNEELEREWARTVLARAEAIGVTHRARADTFERYRQWDSFVLPSRADPFPLSMLEAMATGIPVIGARVDGIAEQITDGCGVLVDPEDPEDLARAIRRVAGRSGADREAMGRAARERIAANFTLEHQAAGMHDAYLAALAARRHAA